MMNLLSLKLTKAYLESGLQHTKNDIEIEPERVKRVQNVVNDHMFGLGI